MDGGSSTKKKKTKRPRPIDRTFSNAFQHYRPPENLTVSQWAERYRVLSRESSAESGPWRNKRTPYLVEIMDSLSDPRIEQITFVSSSQVGKSEAELNAIGYIIDQDPASILYIQPNIDDAKKFSRLRIAPMIRDSRRLRVKVSDVKSRDGSNTTLQKSFPGGMLTIVGSISPSALASTPCRYIIGDELDRWAKSAGTEGDPWGLAEARTTTFYNRKLMAVSSPTVKNASKIADLYSTGTKERWCHRCPECGEWHSIVFNNIKFNHETEVRKDGTKKHTVTDVYYQCPHCDAVSTEQVMKAQPAKWIADDPQAVERGHRSFWLNSFSSPWRGWKDIVLAFLEANGDPQKLQVVYNTIFGELWEDRGNLEDEDTVMSRREDYGCREDGTPIELPDGVLVLTCGVDTQNDRLEYEVVGHGHYRENWGIKKGVLMGDPNDDEVWERLDDVLDHTYRFASGHGLTISWTFVDSGGLRTQSVYRHCRERLNRRVFAIKGVGGDGVPYTRPPGKVKMVVNGRAVGQTWLYSIGVDSGKADIMAALKVQGPGPKYCHFPLGESRGYDSAYFTGLLSERLVLKTDHGRTRWAWEKIKGHERNEALDCRNYAMAAFRQMDVDLDAIERRLQRAKGEGSQKAPTPAPKKRRGVVKRRDKGFDW